MLKIPQIGLRQTVNVAEYLFTRLSQVGICSVHGVPGDYNLAALDYLHQADLKWVGNTNELNAGYAADGYARVKGISAMITTSGVGELSAINALAGAFAEHVPIIHIVGCPSTQSQRNHMLLHHTLGNGNFDAFKTMSDQISCHAVKLISPTDIADQIDDALRQCWLCSRPVYIMLPTDMIEMKIKSGNLMIPLNLQASLNDPRKEDHIVEVILKRLYTAQKPILLIDTFAIRHQVLDEIKALTEKAQIPVFVTPMGRGAFDETNPNFGGLYAGEGSEPRTRHKVESSDLILCIGALKCDLNTTGFSYSISELNTIDFQNTHIRVGYSEYQGVQMKGVLRKLAEQLDSSKLSLIRSPHITRTLSAEVEDPSPTITHAWLWPRLSKFLRETDIVVTETGSPNFGIWDTKFPSSVTALSQLFWGSIGWSVGASQGAALAAKDAGQTRRTILLIGDGSLQMTASELTTIICHKLKVIIFCICNDGYTAERLIHGMDAEYNDIVRWKYKDLVTVLGGDDQTTRKFQVHSKGELNDLLRDEQFNDSSGVQFVELCMDKKDAPRALLLTAKKLGTKERPEDLD
ncbi:pyruvate decarboxylase [Fusarium oxysporum f. sp. lycopersici MN25]|nr:pyruvate decarboxylase [Fusarium oxysporum f. sp. lycopersici MN25]